MKKYYHILIFIVLALAVVGCNKQSKRGDANSGEYVKPNFEYLQSNFSCSINAIEAHGQLRMKSDSLIWISLNKFIELGRIQLTTDSIHLYLKLNNSYFAGTYEQVAERFDYHTSYVDIQNSIVTAIQSKDSNIVTLPIRSNIINHDLKLRLTKIDYPEQIRFPFKIPTSAKLFEPPVIQ